MNQARPDPARELLRHTVATLAYRGAKALRGVTDDVARHKLGASTRTPFQILGHINDLLDWALQLCEGRHIWHDSAADSWTAEVERFHAGLTALDNRLASADPLGHSPERLFQGPIADALTHVGQIALVRRLAASPQRGENYFKAHIAIGCVGPGQAAPVGEFE